MIEAFVVCRTVLLVMCLFVVHRRVTARGDDRRTWRSYRTALAILAGTGVVDTTIALVGFEVGTVPPALTVILQLGTEAVCLFLYRGQILSVRARENGRPVARVDGPIAIGAACAITGMLNAGLTWSASPPPVTFAAQIHLLHLGCLMVVIATTVAVALLGPVVRTARVYLLTAVMTAVFALQAVYVVLPTTVPLLIAMALAWTTLAVTFAAISRLPRPQSRALRPSPVIVPISSILITSCGLLLTLVGGVELARTETAVAIFGWGLAATVFGCLRTVLLVRALVDHDSARTQANTDDLTGLNNRRAFLSLLEDATRRKGPIAVLLLDLDRFKEVNDRYGHAVGDEVLAATALRLTNAAPETASVARLGGDEFAVLLNSDKDGSAVRLAEKLLFAVSDKGDLLTTARTTLGASIGVATSTGSDGVPGQELLRRADSAMFGAKKAGGGVRLHDEALDQAWRGVLALAEDLRESLSLVAPPEAADAFEVHYQPQVSTDTGDVVGVEALVRWRHPNLGLLSPASFLQIVEERGLMPALTARVAHQAARDMADWSRRGVQLRLSINTSTSCLSDPRLLQLIDAIIDSGVSPGRLVVEVTETSLMSDPDRAMTACHDITARGCGLSIDDFGTGYSSLAYLANLPANEIKIDRSFITRALSDDRIAAIVSGTVELAHHLGLRCVAEGVEDEPTLAWLTAIGCEETQGYLHARPLPAAELLNWLTMSTRRTSLAGVRPGRPGKPPQKDEE